MELGMINTLIDKYTHMLTVKYIKNIRKLVLIFFVLSVCLLLTLEAYMATGLFSLLLIAEFTYLTIILKKRMLTIYSGVGVSLILCGHLTLLFNVFLYSIQKIIGFVDLILLTIIFLIEVVCLIVGFFYTLRCVKKGTVRKPKVAVATPIAFVLPSAIGYFLSRYISNEASVQIQNVFFTTVFALGCSMMMFILGMAHVAMIYYIKKYNISDREISKTV